MKRRTLNWQSIDLCNLHIFVQFYACSQALHDLSLRQCQSTVCVLKEPASPDTGVLARFIY